MTESKITNRLSIAVVTLIAGGIFLLGAGLIPLLTNAQQKALESAAPIFPPATTNFSAPQLSLFDLQGNPVSIDEYSGQVILINNWATWCPPCKSEMPELQAFYASHAAEGFVILAIESGEPADQVAAFVKEYGMTFPVWLDPQGKALEIFQNWNLPSSYVIDRKGIVRLTWTGAINLPTLKMYVSPLLEVKK